MSLQYKPTSKAPQLVSPFELHRINAVCSSHNLYAIWNVSSAVPFNQAECICYIETFQCSRWWETIHAAISMPQLYKAKLMRVWIIRIKISTHCNHTKGLLQARSNFLQIKKLFKWQMVSSKWKLINKKNYNLWFNFNHVPNLSTCKRVGFVFSLFNNNRVCMEWNSITRYY